MKNKFLLWLVEQLLSILNPDLMIAAVDNLLDFLEEKIADSETEIDDKLVLPIITMIREAFNIPDED